MYRSGSRKRERKQVTLFPSCGRPGLLGVAASPVPSPEAVPHDGGVKSNTEARLNCSPHGWEQIPSARNSPRCRVGSCVLSGSVYVADGFAKQNSHFPLTRGWEPPPNSGHHGGHWMDGVPNR